MMEPLTLQTVESTARKMLAGAESVAEPFGNPADYRGGLEVLLGSLRDEAKLGPARSQTATTTLASLVASRNADVVLQNTHPELSEAVVSAPIFITGLPRSGTTLLHNLLAVHSSHRAFDLWQLRSPARTLLQPRADLVAETEHMLLLLRQIAPEFARIHPLHAERPDECNWAFRNRFQTLVLAFQFHVPRYLAWMLRTDQLPAYLDYRALLSILCTTDDRPGRPVLKDPCHLWHLDALFTAFPDATVVRLHRDLREALPSFSSLCYTLQSMNAHFDDKKAVGRYCTEVAAVGLERADAATRTRGGQVVDLQYTDLVSRPVETVVSLCTTLGTPTETRDQRRLEDWLDENRQHAAGPHRYSLDEYGISPERIATIQRVPGLPPLL